MRHRAGDRVEVTVTFLSMEGRPAYPRPHLPLGPASALIAAERPPAWYFLDLYGAVGREFDWTDRRDDPQDVLEAFLHDPAVALYTFVRAGWPHGFFVLDARAPEVCNLAYFGLVSEAIGRGLGTFLLHTAVHMAWDRPGASRLTVNTNTLDHPRALPLYQKAGFAPFRRDTETRVLTRDRDMIDA